ncbi:MAG: hypothetical protein M1812_001305 [Candelaria pacifica]|nr:MAG: hypothetical protein M1812_001305 [Candelaria pacifica]
MCMIELYDDVYPNGVRKPRQLLLPCQNSNGERPCDHYIYRQTADHLMPYLEAPAGAMVPRPPLPPPAAQAPPAATPAVVRTSSKKKRRGYWVKGTEFVFEINIPGKGEKRKPAKRDETPEPQFIVVEPPRYDYRVPPPPPPVPMPMPPMPAHWPGQRLPFRPPPPPPPPQPQYPHIEIVNAAPQPPQPPPRPNRQQRRTSPIIVDDRRSSPNSYMTSNGSPVHVQFIEPPEAGHHQQPRAPTPPRRNQGDTYLHRQVERERDRRRRAEAERQQADEDRRQAEAERRRAEAERDRAVILDRERDRARQRELNRERALMAQEREQAEQLGRNLELERLEMERDQLARERQRIEVQEAFEREQLARERQRLEARIEIRQPRRLPAPRRPILLHQDNRGGEGFEDRGERVIQAAVEREARRRQVAGREEVVARRQRSGSRGGFVRRDTIGGGRERIVYEDERRFYGGRR